MKRITYWLLSTVSAVVLLIGFDASVHGGSPPPSSSFVSSGPSGSSVGGSAPRGSTSGGSASGSGNASGPRSSSRAKATMTVTGRVVNTMWGPVQVQLQVNARTITQVKVLQYPHGNSRDLQIADYALPVLVHETMNNQSAHIDMVSGATYTSTGYIQSLQSAIDKARL